MERRHAIRRVTDGLWEVYDIDNNKVVLVGGAPLTDLLDEDALDAFGPDKGWLPDPGPVQEDKGLNKVPLSGRRKLQSQMQTLTRGERDGIRLGFEGS